MTKLWKLLPGLLLTFLLAVISFVTWWFLQTTLLKLSALLWAFIYAILAANLVPYFSRNKFKPGIDFVSSYLCRWSIALLGLTISAAVWVKLGPMGLVIVLVNLALAFIFGFLFCRYVLKLEDTLSVLISVGTSICGASAIAATGPAIRAKAEEMGLAVSTITLFGLLAMFFYPQMFQGFLGSWLNHDPVAFGMWSGIGIHETAQVVAAASQIEGASSMALSAKFIRIFMIGPMVFISILLLRGVSGHSGLNRIKFAVPWFAVLFVILTMIHLLFENLPIKEQWYAFNADILKPVTIFLLAWAFAGVGLKVKASAIRAAGMKAFIGGLAVSLVASVIGLLLVKFLWL